MTRPRLAVFDLGGVVVRICRTWDEACAAAGVSARPARDPAAHGHLLAPVVRAHQRGELGCDDYAARLAGILGGIGADEVRRVHDAWILGDYPGIASAIDRIHAARGEGVQFIVINPGGLTHTSVALRDALLGVAIPFIEVHLSNTFAREPFRHHSYLSDVAKGVLVGLGPLGYELALQAALASLGAAAGSGMAAANAGGKP